MFLNRDASSAIRHCFKRISEVETEEEAIAAFDALEAVAKAEKLVRDKHEAEQRRRDGTFRLIDERQAQSAADEFNQARELALKAGR